MIRASNRSAVHSNARGARVFSWPNLLALGSVHERCLVTCVALALAGCAARIDVQGHRGARGLAPENTLAAFERALEIGVSTLELDTGVTSDGVVIIAHDPKLNPNITRDASGAWLEASGPPIRELSLAELQRYDLGRLKPGTRYAQNHPEQQPADGERIPTLAALFERVRQLGRYDVRFNIETKLSPLEPGLTLEPHAFATALLAVIQAHGMARRVSIQSFDWRTLKAVQRLAPGIPTVCLTVRQSFFDNLADARWTAGYSLAEHGSVPRLVGAAGRVHLVALVRRPRQARTGGGALARLKTVVWTVNEPAQIDAMLELGVDGIISDRPDRVLDALARRASWR